MPRPRFQISISLDGFAAGPDQSEENPLGVGGQRLHEWALGLEAWRAPHGEEGGEANASTKVVEDALANVGAHVMGRNSSAVGGRVGEGPVGRLVGRRPTVFANLEGADVRLESTRVVEAPGVTHLSHRVMR